VLGTDAGGQLRELGGEHRHEEARYWQANLIFERASERIRQGGEPVSLSRVNEAQRLIRTPT
jgi:hypothetical protein